MLPVSPLAQRAMEAVMKAIRPGEDHFERGQAVLNLLELAAQGSALAHALLTEHIWSSSWRGQHTRDLTNFPSFAHFPRTGMGGWSRQTFFSRIQDAAVADHAPEIGERHVARALAGDDGKFLGDIGINGTALVEEVTRLETERERPKQIKSEPLLAELTRLLETSSVVDAHGPTTPEAQEWLAKVSAVLSQVDGAEAVGFDQGAHTIQKPLSSRTVGPIWSEMLLIIRRTIARLKLQTSGGAIDRDALTGLGSREAFDADLPQLLTETREAGAPLALIMSDVDDFKRINDELGHPVGDRALQVVASEMGKIAQGRGRAYRYGGEEMVVILLNTSGPEAIAVAERARASVERLKVKDVGRPITVSVGISVFPDHAGNAKALLKQVDDALYRAKHAGKNRVETARGSA